MSPRANAFGNPGYSMRCEETQILIGAGTFVILQNRGVSA